MSRAKNPDRQLMVETKRAFRRIKRVRDPELLAQVSDKPHLADEEMRNVLACNEVILPFLEALVDELAPFSHMTAMELAIRLASFMLSTVPLEDQPKLVSLFMKAFPNAHDMRISLGHVIPMNWQMGDGTEQINHPVGPILHPKRDE